MSFINSFAIHMVGAAAPVRLKCTGRSRGPQVVLSAPLLDFGLIALEATGTATLVLENLSDVDCVFQVHMDSDSSVFRIDCASGRIAARARRHFVLNFAPTKPISYWKRVPILVHNQVPCLTLYSCFYSAALKGWGTVLECHILCLASSRLAGSALPRPDRHCAQRHGEAASAAAAAPRAVRDAREARPHHLPA